MCKTHKCSPFHVCCVTCKGMPKEWENILDPKKARTRGEILSAGFCRKYNIKNTPDCLIKKISTYNPFGTIDMKFVEISKEK